MKTLTLTIGIPAHNEETNINRMLNSLLTQKEAGFKIEKIIVLSDGSTDKTIESARNVKDSRILVIPEKDNKGRTNRLNQLISLAQTDILIFLDADLVLDDNNCLSYLIYPFLINSDVGVVGGNPSSVGPNTFLTRCLQVTKDIYTEMRYQLKDGHNIFGCMGGMLAIHKKLYKNLKIPKHVLADDYFIYLTCITKGFIFKNARMAKALHPFPTTWSSHFSRIRRFSRSGSELKHYFAGLVEKETFIPKRLILKSTLNQFIKYPIHTSFIFLANKYARRTVEH